MYTIQIECEERERIQRQGCLNILGGEKWAEIRNRHITDRNRPASKREINEE